MPLEDAIISHNKDGSPNEDYCKWCYADGTYTYSSMDDLIDACVRHMTNEHFTEEQARAYMRDLLPTLDYWKRYDELSDNGQFEAFKRQLIQEINDLHVEGLPSWVTMTIMFAAAFLAGGVWCLIAGFTKSKWGVSETLVTLMLNYVAMKLVSYLQYVLWKDPQSMGFPKIANYPDALQFKNVLGVQSGWIVAVVLTVLVWMLLHRLKFGYEIAVLGANERTARYAGMNTGKILLLTSLIGGGICGLAGLIQAAGVNHTLNDQMGNGMGYTAVAIAYMAQMEPAAIVVVSFLFSILLQGSSYMQISMQIPSATGDVIQGIILLFILGSEFFSRYRVTWDRKEKEAAK